MVWHWHHQWAGSAGNAFAVLMTAKLTQTTVFRKLVLILGNFAELLMNHNTKDYQYILAEVDVNEIIV